MIESGETPRPTAVFRGGPVLTMNDSREVLPAGTGVVCADGKISGFLPPGAEAPSGAQVTDLGPGPILPAFLDPHVHFGMTNDSLAYAVDCHTPPRGTIDEILGALSDGIAFAEARKGWLLGQGSLLQDSKLKDQRLPTREDLDKVSTTIPIVVRCGGHVTVLNTRALELSGLWDVTELDGSAHLQRDPAGRPNGILVEGFGLIPIPNLDVVERRAALKETLDSVFTRNGVAYLGEISHSVESLEDLAALAENAPVSVDAFVHLPDTVATVAAASALRRRFSGTPLNIRGVKIFVDGGFSARAAATSTAYAGADHRGELYYSRAQLVELISASTEQDLQVVAHVNGERAQRLVCEAVGIVTRNGRDRIGVRLEHAGNFQPDLSIIDAWRDAGASIMSQPGFIYTMGAYFPEFLGEAGRRGRFPYRSLNAAGVAIGASSDVSGSELRHANPMFNVWCAVERVGFDGRVIESEEAIDVGTALELQTANAATAAGVAHERGSLRPGLAADMVSLESDPRALRGGALVDVAVSQLVRGGVPVGVMSEH